MRSRYGPYASRYFDNEEKISIIDRSIRASTVSLSSTKRRIPLFSKRSFPVPDGSVATIHSPHPPVTSSIFHPPSYINVRETIPSVPCLLNTSGFEPFVVRGFFGAVLTTSGRGFSQRLAYRVAELSRSSYYRIHATKGQYTCPSPPALRQHFRVHRLKSPVSEDFVDAIEGNDSLLHRILSLLPDPSVG